MQSGSHPRSIAIPNFLSHYYEATIGPFVNLSDLPPNQAETQLAQIRQRGETFASQRSVDYLGVRRELEARVRKLFLQKGGRPVRRHPHYMILGACPWGLSWYVSARELRISLDEFSPDTISFTYGDTFPAIRFQDGQPYRGQVFRLDELPGLVLQFGLPQSWNANGEHGPDRYIEAQIWDDAPLKKYLRSQPQSGKEP
jgi:hypothetical protein